MKAYNKKNGKHVAAYDRSTKDSTQANNWSANGNTSPATGKVGSKTIKH